MGKTDGAETAGLHVILSHPLHQNGNKLEKKILSPYNPTKFPLLKSKKYRKMAPALEDPSCVRRDELPAAPYAAT